MICKRRRIPLLIYVYQTRFFLLHFLQVMKVKLQPPSASEFPAYNPILPPTAITQVMLVANPRKVKTAIYLIIGYLKALFFCKEDYA